MKTAPIHNTEFARVVSASNATPIVILTDRPHDLRTGDEVQIDDVEGNLAANGAQVNIASRSNSPNQTVTVLTPLTFELDGSAGSGVHVARTGRVNLLPFIREYPADTLETGDGIDLRESIYGQKMAFSVEAQAQPSPVMTERVLVAVRGKYWFDSEWFTAALIDWNSTWTAGIDDVTRFMSEVRDLNVYPFMRIDVEPQATSTNIVRAWLTI